MDEIKGRCLCRAVSFSAKSPPIWTALCHCESCRRAASAPIVPWMGFAVGDVTWTGERAFYQSSEGVRRSFCPTCGTSLSFEGARWPGEIHVYATSLENPETYVPELHCYYDERLPWLHTVDDLPRYGGAAGTQDGDDT